jgi:23S rRNA (guanosine2251-2'-O)-methyltransferase
MAEPDHLIVGIHSVLAALTQGNTVAEVRIDARRRDRRIREIVDAASSSGVPLRQVSGDELNKLAGSARHQGVVARVRPPETHDEPYLKALLKRLDSPPFFLVLDGVQDPHNLGACLRSADGAGVQAVIAPRDRSVGLTATVCKVASGAAESIPYIQVTNLSRTLKWLQQEGVWLVGTAGEAEQSLYEADLKGPLALVMGGEGKGLRRLTREQCDLLVNLPMRGSVESLNVSVATGVALYEAVRQRSAGKA